MGESSYWEGDAADKFHEALEKDLPTYIKNAARSLEKASTELKSWEGTLSSNRDLAKKYDDDAAEKKNAAKKAETQLESAAKDPDLNTGVLPRTYATQEEADAATDRMRAAERELNAAQSALSKAENAFDDVISKAEKLEDEHQAEAKKVANSLNEATDKLAPRSGLTKALDIIWSSIKNVGQFLLDHAGTIGAIAGLLALFPTPLTPLFAGIAIVASAASMSKNLSDKEFRDQLWGKGTGMETFSAWASLAGDTVGMFPGGKALALAGKEAASGVRMVDEAGEMASRSGAFTEKFSSVFKADASADGAWHAAGESAKGSARLMADISANGLNVGANVHSSLEEGGVVSKEGAGHNAAEGTKAAATLYSLF